MKAVKTALFFFSLLSIGLGYSCNVACDYGVLTINPFILAACKRFQAETCWDYKKLFGKTFAGFAADFGPKMVELGQDMRSSNPSYRFLTKIEKSFLQNYYPAAMLNNVRLHFGCVMGDELVDTLQKWRIVSTIKQLLPGETVVDPGAQTFGFDVYFPPSVKDFGNSPPGKGSEYHEKLLHECCHVNQFWKRSKNINTYAKDYCKGFSQGGFEYAANPMEKECYDLEGDTSRFEVALETFSVNVCNQANFAVSVVQAWGHYPQKDGLYFDSIPRVTGWYNIEPGKCQSFSNKAHGIIYVGAIATIDDKRIALKQKSNPRFCVDPSRVFTYFGKADAWASETAEVPCKKSGAIPIGATLFAYSDTYTIKHQAAYLTLVNYIQDTLSAVVSQNQVTVGWYNIGPGSSVTLFVGFQGDEYVYYVQDSSKKVHWTSSGKDNGLCVHSDKFSYDPRYPCPTSNGAYFVNAGYSRITWRDTVTLTFEPGSTGLPPLSFSLLANYSAHSQYRLATKPPQSASEGSQCAQVDVGDGYCDTNCNVAAHNYDGGDCCESTCKSTPMHNCSTRGYDCRDPQFSPVLTIPYVWNCPASYYGTHDGCDCDCGAPDPDCKDANVAVFNCDSDNKCVNGTCQKERGHVIPKDWKCNSLWYDANDGCDCNCGVVDPDCVKANQQLLNCPRGYQCVIATCSPLIANIPSSWKCPVEYYNSTDGCDCNCGAHDPDCDRPDSTLFQCNSPSAICEKGVCKGELVIPRSWKCDPESYGTNDGCDCNCGAIDPDCSDTSLQLFHCSDNSICEEGLCKSRVSNTVPSVNSSGPSVTLAGAPHVTRFLLIICALVIISM